MIYSVSTQNGPIFIFPITLSKINRFPCFLVWEFLRQFDINSLHISPPYLYTVSTWPWEIQNGHFSTVFFIQTSDYYVISEETNCHCCSAAYLFTCHCLLLPIICLAIFCGQFFLSLWSVIFKATNAKPQLALFRVANIWTNATLLAVRCKSFTFYKVVWWHFFQMWWVTNNLKYVWIILLKMTFFWISQG